MRRTVFIALLGAALACSATNSSGAEKEDLGALLAGVSEIGAPGVPGPLCVVGENAFPVVAGASGKHVEPVVAAARWGKGRVVAFGHTGYFDGKALAAADTGQLVENAIRWAADRANPEKGGLRVGVRRLSGLQTRLRQRGFLVEALSGPNWFGQLRTVNVLCCGSHSLSEADIAAIRRFVRNGGGLVIAGLGWGWLQGNRGKTIGDHPGNRLLAGAGIFWADGYLARTAPGGFAAKGKVLQLCHAGRALDAIAAKSAGKAKLSTADLAQAEAVVTRAVRTVPPDDTLFRPRLTRLEEERGAEAIPTARKPLSSKDALGRLLLTLQLQELRTLPPEKVKPHPAAHFFPGDVPADARKVERTVEIDTSVPRWHSTGLYAPPGRVITVEAPQAAVGKKLQVQIGSHTDRLWHKTSWRRAPEIVRRYPIDQTVTRAANAFGGLVYVIVPNDCGVGTVPVAISGAVEAPHYVQGKTSLADWRTTIRHYGAPWAELETSKVVLTLPSTVVRALDDPKDLMDFWNRVMDACAELAGWPLERRWPERYVADVQISAGYMHAGYPIMTLMDMPKVMANKQRLMSNGHGGIWGLFHETGHNHQSRDWTFRGTGEVTVNLFTLYVFDKVIEFPLEKAHGSISPAARARKLKRYFAGGKPDFEKWKSDPFLALIMYMQIQEAFGWDAYKRVFAEYRKLPKNERPRNDDEKRDQWLVRLSRTVGRDLGPFFQAWGVPTSEKARASIRDLPAWMPPDFPPKPVR